MIIPAIIFLAVVVLLVPPIAYAQSDNIQYSFENSKFEFSDDLGNVVDLKFDRKGQLKLFEIVLYDRDYNDANLQFSRFDTNETDGSFSAFAYSANSVMFLDFSIHNSTFALDLYYNKADSAPVKLHFTGPDTKQYPVAAKNDMAILLAVETAKILKTVQESQTEHVTIPMSQINPLILEIVQTEADLANATKILERYMHLRTTFQYVGNFTEFKKSVIDTRESHGVATKSHLLTENHHELFLSKINTKKIGPMHWEEFDKQKKLIEMYEKALSIQAKFDKFDYDFDYANSTLYTMWHIDKNRYLSSESKSEFKDWFE